MSAIKDILFYILTSYPNKDHLFNSRITKMIYLADWFSAVVFNHQVSPIQWYFNNFGPYVNDGIETASKTPELFNIITVENYYGSEKKVIMTTGNPYSPILTREDIISIDHVIEVTKNKNWDEYIRLVYSTYPIIVSERYTTLDLIQLAIEYKQQSK